MARAFLGILVKLAIATNLALVCHRDSYYIAACVCVLMCCTAAVHRPLY